MVSEQNKAVVRRYFDEVVNEGKLDVVDELFADDFTFHMPFSPEPLKGPDSARQTVAGFRTAFSDLHVAIEELVAEGEKVVARITVSGTNDGELMGTPATNRKARWPVAHMYTFRDGKIIEDVTLMDRMGLMEQLGQVQAPA